MKTWIILLLGLLAGLQYELWFSDGGISSVLQLKSSVEAQLSKNQQLLERNRALEAQVDELKKGGQALEEKARNDFGMLAREEFFYQVIDGDND